VRKTVVGGVRTAHRTGARWREAGRPLPVPPEAGCAVPAVRRPL